MEETTEGISLERAVEKAVTLPPPCQVGGEGVAFSSPRTQVRGALRAPLRGTMCFSMPEGIEDESCSWSPCLVAE